MQSIFFRSGSGGIVAVAPQPPANFCEPSGFKSGAKSNADFPVLSRDQLAGQQVIAGYARGAAAACLENRYTDVKFATVFL